MLANQTENNNAAHTALEHIRMHLNRLSEAKREKSCLQYYYYYDHRKNDDYVEFVCVRLGSVRLAYIYKCTVHNAHKLDWR